MLDFDNVHQFSIPFRGWSLNMTAVRLPSGGLLLHSPTFGGDAVYSAVEKLGPVEILFAPNHYHHLSLGRYRARFPDARAVCSDGARPRLLKKGHRELGSLESVTLPEGARFVTLPHMKNGEAWLIVPGSDGPTWIVCDGFFNITSRINGVVGVFMRAFGNMPGLKLGGTYKWLMRDKRAYRDFVLQLLRESPPRRVLFSHGEPLVDDAAGRLIAETERSIGI